MAFLGIPNGWLVVKIPSFDSWMTGGTPHDELETSIYSHYTPSLTIINHIFTKSWPSLGHQVWVAEV